MLLRDLRAVDRQVAAYPDDASLWITPPGISNSGGNLALHAAGNLRHFVGAVFGKNGYVRDRDAEFSKKGLSREEVRAEVNAAIEDVDRGLDHVDAAQLAAAYPLPIRERTFRTADFLTHLAVHLTYHLGQIDYHRRLLTENPTAVETLPLLEIPAYKTEE